MLPYIVLPKTISRDRLQLNPRQANVAQTGAFYRVASSAIVNEQTAKVKTMGGPKHEKYASERPLLKRRCEQCLALMASPLRLVFIDIVREFHRPRYLWALLQSCCMTGFGVRLVPLVSSSDGMSVAGRRDALPSESKSHCMIEYSHLRRFNRHPEVNSRHSQTCASCWRRATT
jgi:hypothetical protein